MKLSILYISLKIPVLGPKLVIRITNFAMLSINKFTERGKIMSFAFPKLIYLNTRCIKIPS